MESKINIPTKLLDDEIVCFLADRYHTTPTPRCKYFLLQAGRTRGMTSAQVALGCLLQKEPWIVPIPGTTELSHLEENLRTLDFNVSPEEWCELEIAVAAIPVIGERYPAEQQRPVGR